MTTLSRNVAALDAADLPDYHFLVGYLAGSVPSDEWEKAIAAAVAAARTAILEDVAR